MPMLRIVLIAGTITLSGCVEAWDQQPEMQKLMSACDAGNLNACAVVAQARSRARANDIAEAQLFWD